MDPALGLPGQLTGRPGPAGLSRWPGCGPARLWSCQGMGGVVQIGPTVPRRGRGTARGLARARAGGIERPRRGRDLPRHTRAAGLPGGRFRLQPSKAVPVAGHLNGLSRSAAHERCCRLGFPCWDARTSESRISKPGPAAVWHKNLRALRDSAKFDLRLSQPTSS